MEIAGMDSRKRPNRPVWHHWLCWIVKAESRRTFWINSREIDSFESMLGPQKLNSGEFLISVALKEYKSMECEMLSIS